MQLGDSSIPKLHSILLCRNECVMIEAVAGSPAMLINNQPELEATLDEDDIIDIGNFAIQIQKIGSTANETIAPVATNESLAELSAVELVNQLESELKVVEQSERQKHQGISALMQLINASYKQNENNSQTEAESSLIEYIKQIIDCLQQLGQELDERAMQISQREQQYLAAATKLLQSQQQLTGRLETLTEHIPHLLPELQHRRASA